ncbi:Peptidyl-prolyl cis-trans isomerase FKBP65 (PPIase FKBP65) (70 kDa peptidyl-prolyl isomerase) (FK506-binding protein 65) (AtFKBP65) (Immunophilin FKBP65) (Peptidyl-prolyl isomerase ROF2) (Protein ROTAMASE FKBP 2) (Rotamase) [Durusdinium trenchii]|uniref:peptidylprolyl isomerase n=1 Tax=Durusdinium trenchii TaxID=1381693 RepID=A0ABP0Q3X4_9DINO
MGSDEDLLPADIKKEILKKVNFVRRQPKKGDEVEIHYTASLDGALLDTSCNGPPISFTLGMGSVMEAWDRIVATMRKGEIARFTVPEMYLSGGPSQYLAKLPDDGQEVRYEMELVQVVGIRDLFGDGSVIERIHDDGEEYGISPKAGDELQINYELSLKSGKILDSRPGMDFRMVSHAANGVLCSKAIQKSIETFKLNSCGTLVCRSEYIRKEGDGGFEITEDVLIKIQLLQIYEFEDCGKKAFWEEGLVLKKAIQPQRCRLCPGFDGTWCKVKLLSAKLAEEELVQEEEEIETTVGKGELCDALEATCAAMRKGEVSLVTVKDLTLLTPGKPDLKVPEGASGPIVFKLEMVDFGSPGPEEGPSENLLLLNLAKDVKAKGSEHFKLGRFRLAQERYSRVIQLLPKYRKPLGATTNTEVFTEWVEKKTAEELKHSSRLNLAACAVKLNLHYAAARYADEVLKEDPKNIKALYRHAQGSLGANDFEVAAKDCKKILELEPSNKEAGLLLRKVKQTEKEQDKAQREQFGASLGRKLI